ncbi:unnamed protein product [Paramecium primaurelia]|uniref:Protein kinase domain-containing protein n=1 Tax=Paramecium primaurelia TaxID=5886 RepID=A0A8S1PGY9_PARPR|nr:unnamed protein product [Paramecium primaurelia]
MGNTIVLENEDYLKSNILKDKITYVNSKQHKYLGQIQLWKNKLNPQEWIFSKVQIVVKQDKISQIDIDCHFIHSQTCLKKINFYNQRADILRNNQRIRIYYEYLPTNLSMVLKDHQYQGQYVKESFIWKLITQISIVFSYLNSKNKYHSNINIDSLFFDQAHNVKILLCLNVRKLQFEHFFKSLIDEGLLKSIQTYSQINPFKQDSYSFGILLVSKMSGKDLTKYTDFYKEVINYQQILNLLGSFFQYYSQYLINIVVSLLQYDDSKRPNISQIFKVMIHKQPILFYQPQQQTVQQPQTINIYRMDQKKSYSTQNHIYNNQNQYLLISPNKKALPITNNTLVYSSPRKTSTRTLYENPKQFQLVNGFFTPKAKQSRSLSYRFLTSRNFSKVQTPYIK